MTKMSMKPRAAIIGAGPAGLAAAIGLGQRGWDVQLYERYPEVKAAGNILNLWPTPQKALRVLGVDMTGMGAPAFTQLRRHDGRVRAEFRIPEDVAREYNGGFVGLIRWGLYKRMLDTLPPGVLQLGRAFTGFTDNGDSVTAEFASGKPVEVDLLIGADGIDSAVRKGLWGDSPKRYHGLHLMGGWFLGDEPSGTRGVFAHDRTVQGSYTPIRHEGRDGYEWWVLEKWTPRAPFTESDIRAYALSKVGHFADPLPQFIQRTAPEDTHRWEIVDRVPIKQWSKGRVMIIGDAAHPTSPYAAYGAGMSIEDGYFLRRFVPAEKASSTAALRQALQEFEDARKPHTGPVSQQAYFTGRIFHHVPAPFRAMRDFFFDHTKFLQKMQGDGTADHILKQLALVEDAPAPTAHA
ncbi:FAD-dependent monooxygenase [Microbacterium sp. ANT_H45B]|uniref:FAD-dependent oxidoreductase n=1 Tax=Microbacterium sp. ANT_H45B TaxID=2597346 RepID=UPI0011EBFC98|nr:NAD(P)/FAD-dependent oxidoreductase [Microbacterium sp. ANT_H45B]KAA0962490.1 FAD-dependent monooxygenase [Microbacterium sp. ANT_H45B]